MSDPPVNQSETWRQDIGLPGLHTVEMTFRLTDAKTDVVGRLERDLVRIGWKLKAAVDGPLVRITLKGQPDTIPLTLIRTAIRQLEVLRDV